MKCFLKFPKAAIASLASTPNNMEYITFSKLAKPAFLKTESITHKNVR